MVFEGKRVLVTGGTGTLGKTVVNRLISGKDGVPAKITIFSRDETKQNDFRINLLNKQNSTEDIVYSVIDRIKFVIGDIRNYDDVCSVLKNQDIVINAAALKQVPSCEYFPSQAIQTNCLGPINIVNAIVNNNLNIETVVAVSTDKACLDFHSPVELVDGKRLKISDIVRDNKKVDVKTFNELTGEFTSSSVSGWYKNKLNGREMITISYENGGIQGRHKKRLLCTEDHKILTKFGWTEAKNIKNGDLILTNEYMPNDDQLCVLLGTVLGDSSLTKTGNRVALRMGHCKKQEEWLDLKIKYLNMDFYEKDVVKKNRKHDFVRTMSKSSAFLTDIYYSIYVNGKKRIPKGLFQYCFNHNKKLLLSTLLQDDGCITDGLIRLATHSFEREDVEWLVSFLSENGYECYIYNCKYKNTVYPETRFNKIGSNKLKKDLDGYFIMDYKIDKKDSFDKSLWWNKKNGIYYGRAVVGSYKYVSKDVYCIDVENTHNFVVNNIVVHNCKPLNVMGMTKALQEKIFIAANLLETKTKFVCVRYGNVLASRGSVVPLFIDQIKNNYPVTITHEEMTRFLFNVEQAIDVIVNVIKHGFPGEICVPALNSAKITDVIKVLAGDKEVEIKNIGIRPGEKIHEIMISEEEARNCRTEDDKYFFIAPLIPELRQLKYREFNEFSSKDHLINLEELKALFIKEGFIQ